MHGTPDSLLNDGLIQRLIEDAGKVALRLAGGSRDEMLIALAEIRDIAEANLQFLSPEIARSVAESFVWVVANRAAEIEASQKGTPLQ